jgi:hypothetical protein
VRRLFAVVPAVAVVVVGIATGGPAAATGAGEHTATTSAYKAIVINGYTLNPNQRTLTVKVTSYGWKMYPGLQGSKANKPDGGHWILYVNGKALARSATAKATAKNLPKGRIRFFAALANNDGSAVKGATRSDTLTAVVN